MGVLFLLFYVLVAHASSSAYSTQTPHNSRVLALFLDGMRWDFLASVDESGGIQQMRERGHHVSQVKPIFPSNCHANIHALFAGHKMAHPDTFSEDFAPNFTNPDLLWHKASKLGKRVKLYDFAFCAHPEQLGNTSTRLECVAPPPSSPESPLPQPGHLNATLADAVNSLVTRDVHFAAVYYGELDRVAHLEGLSSPHLQRGGRVARDIDHAISHVIDLLDRARDEHQDSAINFVIVSDHGMTKFKSFLGLDNMFKCGLGIVAWVQVRGWRRAYREDRLCDRLSACDRWIHGQHSLPVGEGPVFDSRPSSLLVYQMTPPIPSINVHLNLQTILELDHTLYKLYTPETFTRASWGDVSLGRLAPMILVAEAGYAFASRHYASVRPDHPWENASLAQNSQHGYPPEVEDMATAFYGYGPAFAKSSLPPIVSTYDVSPLLESILFEEGQEKPWQQKTGFLSLVAICASVVIVVVVVALIKLRNRARRQAQDKFLPFADNSDDEDFEEKV